MAHALVDLPENTWVLLTASDISALTFVNISTAETVWFSVTAGATPPTSFDGAVPYPPRAGEINVALSDLAPGVSGGNRVYARSSGRATVSISHA